MTLIFNQYFSPLGLTNSGWKFYITYDVWLAFEAVVVWFLFIETGNLTLEETAAILDSEEVEMEIRMAASEKAMKEPVQGA